MSNSTGESWEISTVENDVSVVSNGVYKGKSLNDLINEFPEAILGTTVYAKFGKQFPLLFKYLDARDDLSIQVHPNDKLAKERHNSFGKTEMWYIMQADENARLILGFKEKSSAEEYVKNLKNKTLLTILDTKTVKQGEVYFLETGTVHAIGAGTLIAEIQQNSDITYRLYDFDRVDANGNLRDLHIDLALEAINYETVEAQKDYLKKENVSNSLVDCRFFTTNIIPLNGEVKVNKSQNSFTVYMCVDGSFEMTINKETFQYCKGDTLLIPASLTDFQFNGHASILEIYIS